MRAANPIEVWVLCRLTALKNQREEITMKQRCLILCLSFLLVSGTGSGQQGAPREKQRYVAAPREFYLLVVASQPDCPLQIEEAKLLLNIEHGWGISCRLHNKGSKPVRYVTLAAWSSHGAGSTFSPASGREKLIMPGQTVSFEEDGSNEIVPLTAELRGRLKLRGPMKDVIVLMVESIQFTDGTIFSDSAISKSLLNYFQDLDQPKAR